MKLYNVYIMNCNGFYSKSCIAKSVTEKTAEDIKKMRAEKDRAMGTITHIEEATETKMEI